MGTENALENSSEVRARQAPDDSRSTAGSGGYVAGLRADNEPVAKQKRDDNLLYRSILDGVLVARATTFSRAHCIMLTVANSAKTCKDSVEFGDDGKTERGRGRLLEEAGAKEESEEGNGWQAQSRASAKPILVDPF
ncbi:hypothetical protein HMN09_00093500 [Mycena chlorophos]|uniref:Uncharacterized protein n=1 Tax=Mycena chlorophos TaxID=658473 RepID=A0A8H6WQ99_MYCCL|nr:hypothetical protein HMN09_00093500 [Mycena chlorophos]